MGLCGSGVGYSKGIGQNRGTMQLMCSPPVLFEYTMSNILWEGCTVPYTDVKGISHNVWRVCVKENALC